MSSSDEGEAHEGGSRKRFESHQVEVLESVFNACPNPDERHRMDLSIRLGLTPEQIKFWFQNKRTQIKVQCDKITNSSIRDENEKLKCKIAEIQMSLKKCICSQEEEQFLQLANKCTKAKIDRYIKNITSQLGSSFSEMNLMQPHDDLLSGGPTNSSSAPSLDNVLPENSSMNAPLLPTNTPLSVTSNTSLIEQATNAMEELLVLVRNDQLWVKPIYEDKDILDVNRYRNIFKKINHHFNVYDIRVEASRVSALVCMDPVALVHTFMNMDKWTDIFPTVVSEAKIVDVLSVGMGGNNYSGSFVLIHSVFGLPSPLIPSREYNFIRYCQLVENGLWCITDVSVHMPGISVKNRRLPSGCLIQEMPNGCSKVVWVEHVEEENKQNLGPIQNFVHSGMAFGAHRWLATLHRVSERLHYCPMPGPPNMDIGAVMTEQIRKNMMLLSHRMVKSFCGSLSPANNTKRWITISDDNEIHIRAFPYNIVDNLASNVILVNVMTSICVPLPAESIFGLFKDESKRDLWDIQSVGIIMQSITNVFTGSTIGNSVSLLRVMNTNQNSPLFLQETLTDSSISMLVYASVDNPSMEIVMNGGDASNISLIPSGVTILPDSNVRLRPSSSSNPTISSSIVTLSFQNLTENMANLNADKLRSIKNLMSEAVQNVKTALNFL